MTLIETLTLGVGAGIAKGVFKLWLGDRPVLVSAASGVADAVKSLTGDFLAGRSAERIFNQIAERVAANVLEVIESEGIELADRRRRVVIDAAGPTISEADFTAGWLIAENLEPETLTRWFLDHGRADVSGFSPEQHDLYRRILSEASQYIVDISSQMPNFAERSVAEVLKRESKLLEKADLILEEVRRIRRRSASADVAEARFEHDYRRAVVRRLDQLQLFGVDLANTSQRYRLSVAYVTLAVERKAQPYRPPEDDRLLEDDRLSEDVRPPQDAPPLDHDLDHDDDQEDFRETVPVDEALAASPRLFIRGPAGSGKTTLLQWAAVMSASRMHQKELADWNDFVPLVIKLREFSERKLPGVDEFVGLISTLLAGDMPEGWAGRLLRSDRAVVLVDGLDELPPARRDEVRAWLADLADVYPTARYVVTSRPHAADEGWLAEQGFADAELQEMDAGDVEAFIDHWHAAVREGLESDDERRELDGLQAELKPKIRSARAVRRLATSPLLCALICALHRDRIKDLPSDRIELYRLCIEMFFRRDRERIVLLPGYPELGDRQKLSLLSDLAYWLVRNGWSQVKIPQADERLGRTLGRLESAPPGTTGRDVRRLFLERTAILRQPDAGLVDFAHRSFQEYLSAIAAVEEGDIGQLVKNADDDQWRETVILAAGLAKPTEADQLVDGLLKRGDRTRKHRYRLHLLAVACLETVVRLPEGSKVKVAVQNRLKKIVPPKTLTQAKELATAGDLVVPHLAYDPRRNAREAAACVRTLALIGDELAYAALEPYAEDQRAAVVVEFIRSRDSSADPDEYTRQFLHRLRGGPRTLILEGKRISQISWIGGLTNLQTLWLNGTAVSEVSPLAGLTNLQTLYLDCTQVSDVSPLAGLTNLRTLWLSSTQVSDVSPLAGLTNLHYLHLNGTQVSDVSPLAELERKGLKIYG